MLRPTKHSHPDRTVVNVALLLLARLRKRRLDGYSALRTYAKKTVAGGDVLFLPALNFLFLLGLIEYRPKTDAIEYVGPNEAV
ncbi:ABC-three component system middle component 8 [Ralstonia sp. 25C]|uniref:ABC-three component system middle component 8 n=1 Tax=Ralstonia sp. 25C TaxID=3447363 RepID=UPI003F750A14